MKNKELKIQSNSHDSLGHRIIIHDHIDKVINVKRLFFVEIKAGVIKGKHGHFIQNQLMFCISGSLKIITKSSDKECITNLEPGQMIYLPANTWVSYEAINDSYIAVASDQHYDPKDYYY